MSNEQKVATVVAGIAQRRVLWRLIRVEADAIADTNEQSACLDNVPIAPQCLQEGVREYGMLRLADAVVEHGLHAT